MNGVQPGDIYVVGTKGPEWFIPMGGGVNEDLILVASCDVDGHEWLALEDAYGVPAFECERCGLVIGGASE